MTYAYEELKEQLSRQAELMNEFGERQQQLQEAIVARDWETIDGLVPEMERLSREVSALDDCRQELFDEAKRDAGLPTEASFAELLDRVPEVDRRPLSGLFRELQVAVLRVKGMTRGIDSFVRGSLRATNEMLGVIYPDQKGTIYSRHGRRNPTDGRAMVLDRRL
ncbi:MAG: flagellar protein FlgN [Spirochaetota bacterium]